MRNKRLVAGLAGAALVGSLSLGAAIANADSGASHHPRTSVSAKAADPSQTVDVLGAMGAVTRAVSDLSDAAKAGGTDRGDLQQRADMVKSAGDDLLTKAPQEDVAGNGRAAVTVRQALSQVQQDIADLLSAALANHPAAVRAALVKLAQDTLVLVSAVLGTLGVGGTATS